MRRPIAAATCSRSAFCCTSCSRAETRSPAGASTRRLTRSSASRPRGSPSGSRRFRERSIRWSTDCSRRIRRRDTSPSGRFARTLRRLSVDLSSLATQPPSGIADRPAGDDGDQADRARTRALSAAAVRRAGEVRPRQLHSAPRRRGDREDPARGRNADCRAAPRVPDAGRTVLRARGHATADPLHRGARGSIATDAAVGLPPGSWCERTGAREADARAPSALPRHADAAGPPGALAAAVPVHEFPGVPRPRGPGDAARHLPRRSAVGGRIDAAADATPRPAARRPPQSSSWPHIARWE